MNKTIIQILKDQISGQTKGHTNISLDNVPVTPAEKKNNVDVPAISNTGVIPSWTHISQQISGSYPIKPNEILDSGSRRFVEELSGQSIVLSSDDMSVGTRHFFGTDIYTANKDAKVSITVASVGGYLGVYSKQSDSSAWSVVYEHPVSLANSIFSKQLNLSVLQHTWTSIAITFVPFATDASFGFTGVWANIGMQRPISVRSYVNSLTAPTWAANPSQQEIDPQTGTYSVLLSWNKSTDENVGGYGVYRESSVSSGIEIDRFVPGTLFSVFSKPKSFRENWFSYFGDIGTLSPSNIIYFLSNTATTHIYDVISNKPNKVHNPIFSNGRTHWGLSANATIKHSTFSKVGNAHVNFDGMLSNGGSIQLFSSYISVSTTENYVVELALTQNLLSKHPFGLGGYGIAASRWLATGGVSSITATRNQVNEYLEVVRGKPDGSFQVENNAFYVSAAASFSLTTAASFIKEDYYKISIHDKDDIELYNTGTLLATYGYKPIIKRFTPSASGTAYIKVTVPGTTSSTDFATLHFKNITLFSSTASMSDTLSLVFLNGAFAACGTPLATISLGQPTNTFSRFTSSLDPLNRYVYDTILGTLRVTATVLPYIPNDCEYLQLRYKAKVNTVSNILPIRREIHFAGLYADPVPNYFPIFATQNVWVKTFSTLYGVIGSTVNLVTYDHLADRPQMSEDGSVIKWLDYDVAIDTKYKYYLDNYDNSSYKNRSPLSAVASLTIADITAPKAPTGYTITPVPGAVSHRWTNPTAQDLAYINCYSDSACLYPIFQLRTSPGSLSKFTETTTTASISVKRVLQAVDIHSNASPTILTTGTLIPEQPTDLSFSIVLLDSSGNPIFPNDNGWYNEPPSITASLLYEGTNALASLFYSARDIVALSYWSAWTVFNGQLTIAASGVWGLRFKAKDVYDNYSSPSDSIIIKYDQDAPEWGLEKSTFWDGPGSTSMPGYNRLSWNDGVPTDSISNVHQYYIRRHIIGTVTADPGFDNSPIGPLGKNTAWFRDTHSTTYGSLFVTDNENEGFYGKKHVKLLSGSGGVINATLLSTNIRVSGGENVFGMVRFALASMDGTTEVKLAIQDSDTRGVLASTTFKNLSLSPTFKFGSVSYTPAGSATLLLSVWATRQNDPGNVSDYLLIDEMLMATNLVLATINRVAAGDFSYTDTDVTSWGRYIYAVVPEDYAGNLGAVSDYKYMRAVANVRDSYRNMLNNSSFERGYFANATLWPENWDDYLLAANNTKLQYAKYGKIVDTEHYHGNQCMLLCGGASGLIVQNNITLLPYVGNDRIYTISVWAKKPDGSSSSLVLGGAVKSTDGNIVSNINSSFSLTNQWVRYTATINQSVPSMQQVSVYMAPDSTGTIYVDAVQFEDNSAGIPSNYYDTTSVTADYIQGALIRGHMIEADTIYTNHLQAGVITAEKMSANSVAASNIQAGSIVASLMAADSVAASNMKANTITTNELNLIGTDIFIRENEDLRIETDVANATLGYGSYCFGTFFLSPNVGYYFCSVAGTPSARLFVGNTSLSFNRSSVSGGFFKPTPLLASTSAPILSVPYPSSPSSYFVVTYRTASGDLCTTSGTIGSGLFSAKTINTPQVIATWFDTNHAEMVYNKNDSSHYLASVKINYAKLGFFQLSPAGTLLNDYTKVFATLLINTALTAMADGTLWCWYTFENSATLNHVQYNTSGQVVGATMELSTHGGLSQASDYLFAHTALPFVTGLTVTHATLNKYIVCYTLRYSNQLFYKVLDNNGAVLVGNNADLELMNNTVNQQAYGGQYQGALHAVGIPNGDVLVYIPAVPKKDPLNSIDYGGKAVYLRRITATINLEELLNRIS